MKYLQILALAAITVSAVSIPSRLHAAQGTGQQPIAEEQFLIETDPGQTQWVTEDEKWELKRVRYTELL